MEKKELTAEQYAGKITARLAKLVYKVTQVLEDKDRELSQNGYDLQNQFRQGFMLAEELVKKAIDGLSSPSQEQEEQINFMQAGKIAERVLSQQTDPCPTCKGIDSNHCPDCIGAEKVVSKPEQKLPNGINLEKLAKLLKFSNKYEISIQFWPDQIAVYIMKDQVDLQDFGGSFDFAVDKSVEYLTRITNGKRS